MVCVRCESETERNCTGAAMRKGKQEQPAELPEPKERLVDRHPEQARLADLVLRMVRVVGISGPSGVGKSALAEFFLATVIPRFQDGQVYFNFNSQGKQAEMLDALAHCLRKLGVHGSLIPSDPHQAASMLR